MSSNGKRRNGKTRKRNGNNGRKAKQAKPKMSDMEKARERVHRALIEKYKYDLRGPNVLKKPMESMVVNPSLPIQVSVSANAFSGLIIHVVSLALSRGWSLNTFDDNFVYWAWRYQFELMIQAARGGVPFTGNVPRWLNIFIQAVIKTTVPYRGGEASYAMIIQDSPNTNFEQLMGPPAYKHLYSMGVKSSTLINGLWPVIVAPSAYNQERGEEATQSLWLFLQDSMGHNTMHKMEPFNTKNLMTDDVSSMAWFQNAPGGGFYDTGGWFKQLFHEVPIRKPIFSVFSPTGPDLFVNRAQVKLHVGSGDSIFLSGLVTDCLKEHQFGMKTQPVIKYLDFLQLADVYIRTIQQAITLRTQTAAFIENVQNNSNYFVQELQCPLTFQQFLLLFRATCMLVYTDNLKCQGTYPRSATGPTDNEFVVYNCGIQTTPIPIGNMMLVPQILQENILAQQSRIGVAGAGGDKNPNIVMCALGQYNSDRLQCEDYLVTYTINDNEFTFCPFADAEEETEINLIDGYFSLSPDGLCAINDPVALVRLATTFNMWIQEQGDHFRKLTSINVDGGVDALSQIAMTLHWKTKGRQLAFKKPKKSKKGSLKKPKAEVEEEEEDLKVPRSKFAKHLKKISITNSVYANREQIAISAGYEIFTAAWTNLQMYWVQFVNTIDPPSSTGDNTGYVRMAAFMREPRQLSLGTGSTQFSTIAERNESYAQLMVKTKFAQDTAQEQLLAHLSDQSEGGVLGGITASLVGAVGHGIVDVGSQMLGNTIPW